MIVLRPPNWRADLLVDLDQRMIRRQARLDVELGAQLAEPERRSTTVASATPSRTSQARRTRKRAY